MPLNPGNDTITFIHQERTGAPGRYGVIDPTETTSVVVGCALQPASQKDAIGNTTYSESDFNCITPVTTFTLAIQPDDYLQDSAGLRYRIMGNGTYRDGWGRNDHITFQCRYEVG